MDYHLPLVTAQGHVTFYQQLLQEVACSRSCPCQPAHLGWHAAATAQAAACAGSAAPAGTGPLQLHRAQSSQKAAVVGHPPQPVGLLLVALGRRADSVTG